jgi:hypothetical protein
MKKILITIAVCLGITTAACAEKVVYTYTSDYANLIVTMEINPDTMRLTRNGKVTIDDGERQYQLRGRDRVDVLQQMLYNAVHGLPQTGDDYQEETNND